MLGIALGSFTQGFTQGIQLGTQLKAIRKQNKLESAVEGITQEGKAQFDADVKAGKADAGDFESTYINHIVPRVANEYLLAGDPDKAAAWSDWADSRAAKKGSKLFASGLQKLQMGETQAGINDMIKAGNTQGYGVDGKMTAAEYYDEQAGAVTGYRLTFTTKDGKAHTKNVATEDLPQFFASFANPQAAFELDQANKAAEAKADLEVRTHGRKKLIEKELGVTPGQMTDAQYQNAVQEERKRIEESALTDPEVEKMSPDEREALAKDTVDKRLGLSGAPDDTGTQVAVDPDTGEQVAMPAAQPTATAAAPAAAPTQAQPAAPVETPAQADPTDQQLGVTPPAQAAPQQAPAPAVQTGDNAPAAVAATPADATSQVPQTDRQAAIGQAAQLIRQGVDPQKIAKALLDSGITPDQWPQDVQMAVQAAQPGISR